MKLPSRTLIVLMFAGQCTIGEAVAADNKDEATMRDVVVSAARIEQNTLESPANVSVVNRDKIETSGAIRVGDALTAKVPSLYMRGGLGTSTRINGGPVVSLRGPGGVRMMLDGISLSDGNAGSLSSLTSINISDIDRIEVVPGSASALYGSEAVGGVINVITKMPTKKEYRLKYLRGFNDAKRNIAEASYRDHWENGLALALTARYEDMAGFVDNNPVVLPVTGAGNGRNAVQGGRKTMTSAGVPAYVVGDRGATPSHAAYFNARLYYALDAKSRFFASFAYTQSHVGFNDFHNYLTRNGRPLNLPTNNVSINGDRLGTVRPTSFWDTSNPNLREENRYIVGYDGKLGEKYDLKVNVGYFTRKGYYVASGRGATFRDGPGTNTNTPNTTLDGSVQLGTAISEKHYLIGGYALTRGTLDRKIYQLSRWRDPEGSRTRVNEESSGTSTNHALFLQDQFFLNDALTLYLGGRYDRWTTHGVAKKYVGSPTGVFDSPARTHSAFSPKFAAVYRWTDTLTVRGSVGSGFKAPSNFSLYATPMQHGQYQILLPNPNVKPERSLSWDLGIEKALPNEGVLKAAYYERRMKDMIYNKISPYTGPKTGTLITVTDVSTPTNAGKAYVRGLELSGEIPLTKWLRASASYSRTDTRITKDESGSGLEGKKLRNVPRDLASFALDAKWQNWRANLSTTYTGLQFSSENNSDVVKNVYGSASKYWLTNLRVSYAFDKYLKLSAGINNLFDKEYYEFYRMPGRNAYVEMEASF
ncbi:TonB-dependent receptor plug domain-containing protein [Dentiradicibacter hellwigii]|uniref:TonB-dependent receptor n=1 Tax=Dentiradicibacter hellwigii TaxID=3149053 RepID=A0ABV4UB56_9RHOO